MHPLRYTWCVWAHYLHEMDWSNTSYTKVTSSSTVEEIIAFNETVVLSEMVLRKYMFFYMKQDILPMWEDASNRLGGCFWFKIPLENVVGNWKTILYTIIGNTISEIPNFINDICGVVLSPKKHYYNVQIWMKTRDHSVNDICSTIQTVAGNSISFKPHAVT